MDDVDHRRRGHQTSGKPGCCRAFELSDATPTPELGASDGARPLVLRPDTMTLTGIATGELSPIPSHVRIRASPTFTPDAAWIREAGLVGRGSVDAHLEIRILDVRGR